MSNSLALILGVLLVGAVVFDVAVHDGTNLIIFGRRFLELLNWMAFWR